MLFVDVQFLYSFENLELVGIIVVAQTSHVTSAETVRQRAVFKLARRLQQAAIHSRLDADNLRGYLKSLRQQALHEMKPTSEADSGTASRLGIGTDSEE